MNQSKTFQITCIKSILIDSKYQNIVHMPIPNHNLNSSNKFLHQVKKNFLLLKIVSISIIPYETHNTINCTTSMVSKEMAMGNENHRSCKCVTKQILNNNMWYINFMWEWEKGFFLFKLLEVICKRKYRK